MAMPHQSHVEEDGFGINIILTTIRFDDAFRDIVDAAIRACRRNPGLRLTIADGSLEAAKAAWIDAEMRAAGADIVLIRDPDFSRRLQAAVDPAFAWTLFLSDDDPFTVNYFSSFAAKARKVGPEVTTIAPSLYLGHGCGRLMVRTASPFAGSTLAERLRRFHAQPLLAPASFYSLVRTRVVAEWSRYLHGKGYSPSYADQLLTTLSVARGDFEVVEGFTALIRDEATWIDPDQSTRANARYYPRPEMVLFHELFWIADMVALLSGSDGFADACPELKSWAMRMMAALANEFPRRAAFLGASATAALAQPVEGCAMIQRWLQQTSDPAQLANGFAFVADFAAQTQAAILDPVAPAEGDSSPAEEAACAS
jgi:hypothetical protein